MSKHKTAHEHIQTLIERYRLMTERSPAAVDELASAVAEPGFDDRTEDLTRLPFVTIDNPDSRDLDQALFLEPRGNGYRVWYALADASYYIRPGMALHAEALARGASYYLPTTAIPMLPRALSEDIVSLNPGVDRRALVFEITLGGQGQVETTNVRRGRIHSRRKLSYEGVQGDFDSNTGALADPTIGPSLRLLREVGDLRIALARQRHVVEYERREVRVGVDPDDPTRFVLDSRRRNDVELWNEQISLLCNIEGARLLQDAGRLDPDLQSVFRVHLPPLPDRLGGLVTTIDEIIRLHGLDSGWRWAGPQGEPLADYLERLPRGDTTQRVRSAIDRQVRLSNQASSFTAEAGPHHALGVDAYARFSAPMREIVGIFTHKELLETLGWEPALDRQADADLRDRVIRAANDSKAMQKRLNKAVELMAIDQLLRADLELPVEQRPGRVGTVVGMQRDRVYVALDDFPLDLKIYLSDLEAHRECQYEMTAAALVPRDPGASGAETLRIGDAVAVRTLAWDAVRRRFALDPTIPG